MEMAALVKPPVPFRRKPQSPFPVRNQAENAIPELLGNPGECPIPIYVILPRGAEVGRENDCGRIPRPLHEYNVDGRERSLGVRHEGVGNRDQFPVNGDARPWGMRKEMVE
jgi:hypothetical protein